MQQTETASVPGGPLAYQHRWKILAVVLLADVVDLVDATIANLAGPSIRADLGGGESALQWVLAAYTLAFAIGLITSGRLGDLLGRRKLFIIGMSGFTLASVACGLAPSIELLIAARFLQGAFGAVMIPQGFAMVKMSFPRDQLRQAFVPFGPALGLSAVIAPILGGILIGGPEGGPGWRWILLINLPVGVIGVFLAMRYLPHNASAPTTERIDVPGMVLITIASALLIYPLVQGRESGWPVWMFAMMAAAALVFAIFVRRERSSAHPVIEPSLFRHRGFRGGLLVIGTFFAAVSALMLTVNLFFQLGLGYAAFDAGLAMIPMAIGISIGAGASGGFLGERFGRRVLHAGIIVCVLGAAWLWFALRVHGLEASTRTLAPSLVCLGIGMGLVFAPLFDIIIADLDEREVGTGSGVLNAVQQFAATLGVAVFGTIFFNAVASRGFAGATQLIALVAIAAFLIAAAAVFALPKRARGEEADPLTDPASVPVVSQDERPDAVVSN